MPKIITKTQRRKQRQEELREKLSGIALINQIDKAEERLMAHAMGEIEMNASQVQALSKVMDSQYRKLSKLLPDLKATELTGEGGGPIAYTETEREARINSILDNARKRAASNSENKLQ